MTAPAARLSTLTRSRASLLVLAVSLLTAAPSLWNGFAYDDVSLVERDRRIRDIERLPGLLVEPYWPDRFVDRLYRPWTTASFAVAHALGGGAAWPQHLLNVLLHAAVCVMVVRLIWALAPPGALLAGLWFAVHPVHVEAFASVTGRSELIAAAGYLTSLLAALRHARAERAGERRAMLALATGAAAFAIGGKEHAITLPAAIVVMDGVLALHRGEDLRARARRQAPLWLATAAVMLAYLSVRAWVVGTATGAGMVATGLEGRDLFGRLLVMAPALLEWARLILVPLRLAADYAPDQFVVATGLEWRHAAALALASGVTLLVWRYRKWDFRLPAALLLFTVSASVAANIVVPTGVLISERGLYLPSVAVALGLAPLMAGFERGRLPALAAAAVVLLALAARSVERISVWRDDDRFFAALETDAPFSYRTQWMLGRDAFKEGRIAEGQVRFREAMRRAPREANLHIEAGLRHLDAHLNDSAEAYLMRAFELDSMMRGALLGVIVARARLGRYAEAAAAAELGMRRFPGTVDFVQAAGELYALLGRCADAEARLREVERREPGRVAHLLQRLQPEPPCVPS
ncbi:MAG TPA: hypothetical protein VNL98_13685 [Gemmatimonadales bacterium]|nr:hypothetical protein [Gemmatimonadales bacterium]